MCTYNSIFDWLITWHFYFGNQPESIFKYLDSLLKNCTNVLTISLIGLKMNTSFVLTNRLVVLRGLWWVLVGISIFISWFYIVGVNRLMFCTNSSRASSNGFHTIIIIVTFSFWLSVRIPHHFLHSRCTCMGRSFKVPIKWALLRGIHSDSLKCRRACPIGCVNRVSL